MSIKAIRCSTRTRTQTRDKTAHICELTQNNLRTKEKAHAAGRQGGDAVPCIASTKQKARAVR